MVKDAILGKKYNCIQIALMWDNQISRTTSNARIDLKKKANCELVILIN